MTQPIEPPQGYELLPEGTVPRDGDKFLDCSGKWKTTTDNWDNNKCKFPVARRIETPAREWIPFPPAPGGMSCPSFLPDRAIWVTDDTGHVFATTSVVLNYRLNNMGCKYLAWRECEPQPEPYVPPETEAEKPKRAEYWIYRDKTVYESREEAGRCCEDDLTHVREVLPGDVDPDAANDLVDYMEHRACQWPEELFQLLNKCRRSADA